MRTVLLFLFFGCLSVLMGCAEAARWLLLHTCPALRARWPLPPHSVRNKQPASLAAVSQPPVALGESL